jgi:hypothetical protein
MKKVIFLSLFLLTLTGMKALAQTDDQGAKPVQKGNEWQMPKDVLVRSRNFSDYWKKELGLDDPTTKKVFNAYLGNTKAVDEIRMGQGSEKDKKNALAVNQEQFDQTLKGIFTSSQFNAYLKLKKKGVI